MTGLDPELRQSVAGTPVGRLASVRPDGRPHVVPLTFALEGDQIASAIDHKPKTTTALQRLRNIAAHPEVSVIFDHYEPDWTRLWWVRADGRATVVTTGERRDRALDRLVEKYPQYRAEPPEGPVILIAVSHWSTWTARPGG